MSTERSHILKKSYSWKLQVCLSMCTLPWKPSTKRLRVEAKILSSRRKKKNQRKHVFCDILHNANYEIAKFKKNLVTAIEVCQFPSFAFPHQGDLHLYSWPWDGYLHGIKGICSTYDNEALPYRVKQITIKKNSVLGGIHKVSKIPTGEKFWLEVPARSCHFITKSFSKF